MSLILFLLVQFVVQSLTKEVPVLGVSDLQISRYQPDEDGKWHCLEDTSILLKFNQINDGICDCPDGSDEPGTGACGDLTTFYCANDGFIPRYIMGSKVSDSVCDCCDCSDEKWAGLAKSANSYCNELRQEYDELMKNELKKFDKGKGELIKLTGDNDSTVNENNSSVNETEIKEKIDALEVKLYNENFRYNMEKDNYLQILKLNNHILYEFEMLDVKYMAAVVNETYYDLIELDGAFNDISQILDTLLVSYTRSLNDKVVNSNVNKYSKISSDPEWSKIMADVKVDEEQRKQVIEFFDTTMPEFFLYGDYENDAEYMIKKTAFVQGIIRGRVSYSEKVRNEIGKLETLLSDISSNYNVNFQDNGVKAAVEAYSTYLGKFSGITSRKIQLPSEFLKRLAELALLVKNNAAEIIAMDEINQWSIEHKINSNEGSLRVQLQKHELQLKSLNERLEEAKVELATIQQANSSLDTGGSELLEIEHVLSSLTQPCLLDIIDDYQYELCLQPDWHGSITQMKPGKPETKLIVGYFKGAFLEPDMVQTKYMEYLRKHTLDQDIFDHLINETRTQDGHSETYMLDNLHEMNNGLVIEYDGGMQCWEGPQRSAKVVFQCGSTFDIKAVTEVSKCYYVIDIVSPLGCNKLFKPHLR